MPRSSTAEANALICPLCGERLASDNEGRGYVRHLAPPRGTEIFDDAEKIDQMVESGDLDPDFMEYFNDTGLCPFQQGQRDEPDQPESGEGQAPRVARC